MATWELNTKGISGIAEARELPGLAAKTLVSYCPRCTGSPRWPSAGYLVPTRAPWMRPTCQATSTSSSSGSIVVTPEAEGCFSTVFWNLRSSMHLFDTRTSSPPSVHGQCHLSLHIDEGTHPAWRCLPRTARGGGKPTPVKWRAQTFNMLGWPGVVAGYNINTATENGSALPADHGQQDSTNMGFPGVASFFLPLADPDIVDSYTFTLTAICGTGTCGGPGVVLGSVTMVVNTVPEPASMAALGVGILGMTAIRRRRKA